MEFVRVGEALLRSSQPILPFLAPSVYGHRSLAAISRSKAPHSLAHQPIRSFSACCSSRSPNTADQHHTASPSTQTSGSPGSEIGQLLDDVLNRNKGTPVAPAGRTSRFKTPSAQLSNSPSRMEARKEQNEANNEKQGVIADLMDLFPVPSNRPGSSPSGVAQRGPNNRMNVGSMNFGFISPGNQAASLPPAPLLPAPMKLDSTAGRTIPINTNRGMDVARAFRTLGMQCSRNSVKTDFMRQRFHERPGLKRKRLRSQRWRKRFKENFKATVAMVMKMKAQGW